MATVELNDLIADGELPKRSGTTLTGDSISELAADVANNAAAQAVLDARYAPLGGWDGASIEVVTRAEYDALSPPDAFTVYFVSGSGSSSSPTVLVMTQAAYDTLSPPDADTVYLVIS